MRQYSWIDRALSGLDKLARGQIQSPQAQSVAYMRANHQAQLCTQALYQAQALMAGDDSLATRFVESAQEKEEHLKWTEVRLQELNGQSSVLNPIGYAGAFTIGILVGLLGDNLSLGFLAKHQYQSARQLQKDILLLPAQDIQSRFILQQMQRAKRQATQTSNEDPMATLGIMPQLMHWSAWIMHKTSYYI